MITIRPIKNTDFNQITQIEFESFSDPYPAHTFQVLAEYVADLFLVALEQEGQIEVLHGYVVADIEQKTGFNIGHILSLAVRRKKRRKGIGRQLLTALIGLLRKRNCKEVILEVRVSNYSAKAFYQKHNFHVIKRSRKYYKDGEDALVMALSLEDQL